MAHRYKQHPSPTGYLIGGQLVPVPEAVAATETVWLVLPDESRFRLRRRKGRIWEGLAAEATEAKDRVIVRAVPLFAYDVNYGDELSVVASAEGPLVATGVTKDAGNYTFRAWMREDAGDGEFQDGEAVRRTGMPYRGVQRQAHRSFKQSHKRSGRSGRPRDGRTRRPPHLRDWPSTDVLTAAVRVGPSSARDVESPGCLGRSP